MRRNSRYRDDLVSLGGYMTVRVMIRSAETCGRGRLGGIIDLDRRYIPLCSTKNER